MSRRVLLFGLLALASCKASVRCGASSGAAPDSTHPMGEQRILRAAMLSVPQAGVNPDSLPDKDDPGAKVLIQYCTQCHALPSPAAHGAQDWPFVARQMWLFIDQMRGELGVQSPSTAERAQLLAYLQTHALEVAASLPPGGATRRGTGRTW